jgi:hypothetical protein
MVPLAFNFHGLSEIHLAFLISGAVLIFAIGRWRKNTMARNHAAHPAPASDETGPALTTREVAMEVQALLAELEEASRRLTAQLDNRYTRLEQLVAEADEKIRRLEQLSGALQPAILPEPAAPSEAPTHTVAEPMLAKGQRTLARLRNERGAGPAGQDPAYQPIYTLADGGKTPREIAQELGRQPGEIELILALRRQTAST